MGYGMLPEPGSDNGPCEDIHCGHKDCQATRTMARSACRICDKPIGYMTPFYDESRRQDTNKGLVLAHASCVMEEADGKRKGRKSKTADELPFDPIAAADKAAAAPTGTLVHDLEHGHIDRSGKGTYQISEALLYTTERVYAAQGELDDLEIAYEDQHTKIALKALDLRMFTDDKTGGKRKATNAEERELVVKRSVRSNKTLRNMRRQLKTARRAVTLFRNRQENYRVILAALPIPK